MLSSHVFSMFEFARIAACLAASKLDCSFSVVVVRRPAGDYGYRVEPGNSPHALFVALWWAQ